MDLIKDWYGFDITSLKAGPLEQIVWEPLPPERSSTRREKDLLPISFKEGAFNRESPRPVPGLVEEAADGCQGQGRAAISECHRFLE